MVAAGSVLAAVAAFCAAAEGPAAEAPRRFTLQLTERLRLVSWDDAVTLGATPGDTTFSRTLTSLAGTWRPAEGFELAFDVVNEFRHYWKPEDRPFTFHEIGLRGLLARWPRPKGRPFTLVLGRQNIMLGEGFLVMDGNPLDGARTVYFNAARLDLHLGPRSADTLTVFAAVQPETDPLPVVNDQDQPLVEQPQRALGLYYVRPRPEATLEGYLIHKRELPGSRDPVSARITAGGGRVIVPLAFGLEAVAEAAYQWGEREQAPIRAWGGHARLSRRLGDSGASGHRATLGVVSLSGDNPQTASWEGWNPLFSRWPKWSEAYIYTLIPEQAGRPAYWTNFTSVHAGLELGLAPGSTLELTYHRLGAMHPAGRGASFPGGAGTRRGDLLIALWSWRASPRVAGHVRLEHFRPGSFYRDDARTYTWARVELLIRL